MSHTQLQRWWIKAVFVFAFWTVLGLIFSTQTYLYLVTQYPGFTWSRALQNGMPIWYIWGALTPLITRLDRSLPIRREQVLKRILWHLPLSVLWVLLHFALRLGVEQALNPEPALGFSDMIGSFPMTTQIYWLILGVAVAYDFFQAYRDRELRASQLEARLSEARLQALRAQLHPHFLFNTLNAISAFMEKDPQTARLMTAHLGELLRFSLDRAEQQEISLAEELACLENYLAIQRIRFAERLKIEMNIEPAALTALVPSLLLQPLVENAIRHGLTPSAAAGKIFVRAQREADKLKMQISDDGVGLPEGWQLAAHQGLGISNTMERLAQLYNGRHQFEIKNNLTGGITIAITLPFHIAPDEPHSHIDRG